MNAPSDIIPGCKPGSHPTPPPRAGAKSPPPPVPGANISGEFGGGK